MNEQERMTVELLRAVFGEVPVPAFQWSQGGVRVAIGACVVKSPRKPGRKWTLSSQVGTRWADSMEEAVAWAAQALFLDRLDKAIGRIPAERVTPGPTESIPNKP